MIIKQSDLEEKKLMAMKKEDLIKLIKEMELFLLRVRRKPKDKLKMTGKIKLTMTDVRTGEVEVAEYKNVIPTVGREAIARRLIDEGLKSNESIITYGAVGTGTTSASVSDTKLESELFRKTIASTSRTNNVIHIRTFYTTSEANGELKEFGLFGEDATATADSGTLFERVNINRTKTNSKTLLIESVITIE